MGRPPRCRSGAGGPDALVAALRGRGSDADAHLVGGPRTIAAVHGAGALGSLELVVLPVLLGDGPSLWSNDAGTAVARMVGPPRAHPDGSLQLTYVLT